MIVGLALIVADDKWHFRAALNLGHVDGLIDAYANNDPVPPLKVVRLDDGSFALVDGYHRHAALLASRRDSAEVEVVAEGEPEIATIEALAANAYQTALPRSLADKAKAVKAARAWWPDASNGVLAGLCCVPEALVEGLLAETPTAKPAKPAKPDPSMTAFEHMTEFAAKLSAFRVTADKHLNACGKSGAIASCALDDVQTSVNIALAQMKSAGVLAAYKAAQEGEILNRGETSDGDG